MLRIVTVLVAVILIVHGLIHLMGTAVYARHAQIKGLTYKTTLLNGRWDLGEEGIRVFGALWVLPAIGFVAAALALLAGLEWWKPVLVGVTRKPFCRFRRGQPGLHGKNRELRRGRRIHSEVHLSRIHILEQPNPVATTGLALSHEVLFRNALACPRFLLNGKQHQPPRLRVRHARAPWMNQRFLLPKQAGILHGQCA